jgi:class 3 adenylate cyclase
MDDTSFKSGPDEKRVVRTTVLVCDLVGYSRICAELEAIAKAKNLDIIDDQILACIDAGFAQLRSKGTDPWEMIDTGDGTILFFARAQDAFRFAVAFHEESCRYNRKEPVKYVFRSGAATGNVLIQQRHGHEVIRGMAICRAVRLQSAAKPGALLVDNTTFEDLTIKQRQAFGGAVTVLGKGKERFRGRACTLNRDGRKDVPTGRCKRVMWRSAVAALIFALGFYCGTSGRGHKPQTPVWPSILFFSQVASGLTPTAQPLAWTGLRKDIRLSLLRLPEYHGRAEDFVQAMTLRDNFQQLEALRSTSVQVFALSAGAVGDVLLDPRYRFRPVFELCRSNGLPMRYRPVFIVNNGLTQVSNLDGLVDTLKTNRFARFGYGQANSHSSYRVPFLVFNRAYATNNQPVPKDRFVRTGCPQGELIDWVATNSWAAACVASDALALSQRTNLCHAIDWSMTRLMPEGLEFLTNETPSVSFGWCQDLPVRLQLALEEGFMNHKWRQDADFSNAYARLYPSVVGITNSRYFLEPTNWGYLLEVKRLVDAAPTARSTTR